MLEDFSSELDQLQPLIKVLHSGEDIKVRTVEAARQGVLSILRCMHQSAVGYELNPWSVEVCTAAAGAHLECLKYAHEQRLPLG